MKKTSPFTINSNVLGNKLEENVGIKKATRLFNMYRAAHGLSPVQPQTVKRYNGGGGWYDTNTPRMYRSFLISLIK
jgi:hypothetical protein